MDGPVVTAARQALESDDVRVVLPYVPLRDEDEIRSVFESVREARGSDEPARDVADRLFFETVVRLHRMGEGAPYTGLKPAGLSVGPVIPLAERAIEADSPKPVAEYLTEALNQQLERRLAEVSRLASVKDRSIADARAYVEAMLGFQVYSHHLWKAMEAPAHSEHNGAGH
ncbi:hypothetical protein HGB48_03445 [Actinomadura latina]|uniref:Uncharacterized protein n=1 Tax=Actinomadura latina TaxID=163603 RepID=A0A846YPW8_9ACTN|nr:hypothetical protein [Actinomadura latina]